MKRGQVVKLRFPYMTENRTDRSGSRLVVRQLSRARKYFSACKHCKKELVAGQLYAVGAESACDKYCLNCVVPLEESDSFYGHHKQPAFFLGENSTRS